jgi:Cytochrome P450
MADSLPEPVAFGRDPLAYLDGLAPTVGETAWLPGRQLCVAEPRAARGVLANSERLYREHSDFFQTTRGTLGPRVAQVEIARTARRLLRAQLETERRGSWARHPSFDGLFEDGWPNAGNWLIHQLLGAALVRPDRSPEVAALVQEIVERAVLAGARERQSQVRRFFFRRRVRRTLVAAIERRRSEPAGEAVDVLDAVAWGAPPDQPVVGSAGFVLGWAIYLLGTHPNTRAEPSWVVHEALRLWPVAWLFARRPACDHSVAGVRVTPRDEVIVCPYLTHRLPRYWSEPTRFLPERWAEPREHQAYLPFGWGPHSCAGAGLTVELVGEILRFLGEGPAWALTVHDPQPFVGPALAPPRFSLDRVAGLDAGP